MCWSFWWIHQLSDLVCKLNIAFILVGPPLIYSVAAINCFRGFFGESTNFVIYFFMIRRTWFLVDPPSRVILNFVSLFGGFTNFLVLYINWHVLCFFCLFTCLENFWWMHQHCTLNLFVELHLVDPPNIWILKFCLHFLFLVSSPNLISKILRQTDFCIFRWNHQ